MEEYFKLLAPMRPLPTGMAAANRLSGEESARIRAVLFDIYGTLLISDSGDVGLARFREETATAALEQVGVEFCRGTDGRERGRAVIQEYLQSIRDHHSELAAVGTSHPEVVIEHVWGDVLERLVDNGWIRKGEDWDTREVAISFEFLNNPTYPMPGMAETLSGLHDRHIALGTISNAQFFTPMLLKYFLGEVEFLIEGPIPYFGEAHNEFSYIAREAKPGAGMYERMRLKLSGRGIAPDAVLFVGNDMLNDILPARRVGFRTALFAGDKRSLRLRKDREEVRGLEPDMVLLELPSLLEILPGA